jgi:hypothetical protein
MITEMANAAAGQFDVFICHGNSASSYAKALVDAPIGTDKIIKEQDLISACRKARSLVGVNDLVYVQIAYPQDHADIRQALCESVS